MRLHLAVRTTPTGCNFFSFYGNELRTIQSSGSVSMNFTVSWPLMYNCTLEGVVFKFRLCGGVVSRLRHVAGQLQRVVEFVMEGKVSSSGGTCERLPFTLHLY